MNDCREMKLLCQLELNFEYALLVFCGTIHVMIIESDFSDCFAPIVSRRTTNGIKMFLRKRFCMVRMHTGSRENPRMLSCKRETRLDVLYRIGNAENLPNSRCMRTPNHLFDISIELRSREMTMRINH